MGQTTFSGPVASTNGFSGPSVGYTVSTTAQLPAASSVPAGTVRVISDNGAGNNEYCLVISTGAAWVTAVGAALS